MCSSHLYLRYCAHISHLALPTLDCNNDLQCGVGLKCLLNGKGESIKVPGCTGEIKIDQDDEDPWDYCYDPSHVFCRERVDQLKTARDKLSIDAQGLNRIFFDESIALLFGNSTTIGQVCAYSRGLASQTVEGTPGFCCLDAPYEANEWGETVSMNICQILPSLICLIFSNVVSFESMLVKSTFFHHQVQPWFNKRMLKIATTLVL